MPPTLVWLLVAALTLAGLIGSVVPGLPGAPLIFAAAAVLEVFLPRYLSGWTLAGLAVLAAFSAVLDLALAAAGGRRLGGGRWGMIGAGVGAALGLAFGPVGLFAGAFAGAVAGEFLIGKKPLDLAAKAGLGAWLGLVASTAGKAALALAMAAWLAADAFLL